MSILDNSSNVVIDNAKLSSAGRDVRTTTQHSNSAFASSSDQVIVMEQPNVINAGGNITYITWNFQLLELAAAALSLAFSPFRTRASNTAEPQSPLNAESSGTGRDASSQNKNALTTCLAALDIGVTMFPKHDEGNIPPAIRQVGSVPSKAYIESMIQLGIGYPMCNPQPHRDLPLSYRRSGVSFGDLGVIKDDGDFDFLFNVLLRAKDPVNIPANLPEDFDTPQRPNVMPRFRPGSYDEASHLSNLRDVTTGLDQHSKDISLFCTDRGSGAVLLLPHGASENDLRDEWRWKDFISQNALSWYKYARDNCGRELDYHSLYLITGHMKSETWGLATFNTSAGERNDVLVMGQSTAPKRPPYIWKEFRGTSRHRSGPMPDPELVNEDRDDDIENQCLFLRGFKISLSEQAWNNLWDDSPLKITNKDSQSPEKRQHFNRDRDSKGKGKDESGSNSSSQGNLGNSVSLSSFPLRSIPFHPSNNINDLLLSLVPDAQIAITHDNVWMDVVQSKHVKEEMLAATFGSNFVASYYEDTGMCTFEPVKEVIPMLKQVGSLSKENIKLHESLTHMLNKWTSIKSTAVADCLELCTDIMLGKEQSETLARMKNLIRKYNEQGECVEAKDMLDLQARTLGKEHPDTLASMHKLALTYYKQHKWADAGSLQSQVLRMRARIIGNEHPETLTSMYNLALTYYKQKRWTKAQSLQSQVLEMSTRIYGNEHPYTLDSMHELALTYYKQDRWTDAENLQSQIVQTRTRILGKEHPKTLDSMYKLALTYYRQESWTEAENLQSQVLRMRTRILGQGHPKTLDSMYYLAITYYKQEKCKEAEYLQIRVLEMSTSILGKEHPDTLASMYNLAMTYYKQDRWTDAETLQSQVLEMCTRILGNEHPRTLASDYHLNLIHDQIRIETRQADSTKKVPDITGKNTGRKRVSYGAILQRITRWPHERYARR